MNDWVNQTYRLLISGAKSAAGGGGAGCARVGGSSFSRPRNPNRMLPVVLGVLLGAASTVLQAQQRDVFEKPQRLEYGDPATIAPMMGPVMTLSLIHI